MYIPSFPFSFANLKTKKEKTAYTRTREALSQLHRRMQRIHNWRSRVSILNNCVSALNETQLMYNVLVKHCIS